MVLFQNETSRLGGVKCLMWKPQWNIYVYFFFPSNQQLQHTPKQVKMDVSFWVKHVHVHLRQQQHWRVIFPHSGFLLLQCFYKPQVQNIQEHVVILLSNNCAVFVVHFWPVFDITSMPWHEDLILNLSCPQRLSFYLSTTKDRRSPATLLSAPSNTHVTQVRAHVCRCTSKKVFPGLRTNTEASSTLQLMIVTISVRIKASVSFLFVFFVFFFIKTVGLFVQSWEENPFVLLGN